MELSIKIFLILLLFSSGLLASEGPKRGFSAAVGIQAKSLLHKRGIVTYGSHQIVPIYSLQLYYPELLLAGSAIYYKLSMSDETLLRARINFNATEDDPLYSTQESKHERVKRRETTEFDLFIEKYFKDDSFLRTQFSRDLNAHEGYYFEFFGRLSLVDLMTPTESKPLVDVGIFSSVGYGSSAHNQYLYGQGADGDSWNNIEYGISVTSPKVIDSFWPTFQLSEFQILGDNKNGSYLRETKAIAVEFLAAFKVW